MEERQREEQRVGRDESSSVILPLKLDFLLLSLLLYQMRQQFSLL